MTFLRGNNNSTRSEGFWHLSCKGALIEPCGVFRACVALGHFITFFQESIVSFFALCSLDRNRTVSVFLLRLKKLWVSSLILRKFFLSTAECSLSGDKNVTEKKWNRLQGLQRLIYSAEKGFAQSERRGTLPLHILNTNIKQQFWMFKLNRQIFKG